MTGDLFAAAQAAHSGTSFVPETRARQEVEAHAAGLANDRKIVESVLERAKRRGATLVAVDLDAWGARHAAAVGAATRAYFHARAGCMSWMITGPSNFPTRRNEKRWKSADRRREEVEAARRGSIRAIVREALPMGDGRAVYSRDPSAAEKLAERIANLERLQDAMKDANAAIRRARFNPKTQEGRAEAIAALEALGFKPGRAADLLAPDFAGRIGFAAYELQNNSANIRRLRQRTDDVEKQAATADAWERTGEGWRAYIADGRVLWESPGKPPEEIRDALKSHGWKWAPSRSAWSRLDSLNARAAFDCYVKPKLPALEAAGA